ncbi:hypothetical protein H0H81_003632 [Sphagnurus paluster]|uniref:mannosyl-oligosaccharide 1,2-alpha-mannosidase n=1 Tax=Sphagnurus paluster TaxID=117069 RepID=A0A9P7GLE3_9AGAR|nr:hypothetical protein H0H81_003632 [Sphagnurus paluster]
MSTMQIMGLDAYFTEAVQFASQIDFNKSNTSDPVSVFETTIRYLGGLLSAFELSEGKYPSLLDKAKQVADKMSFAWVDSNIAEAGTLTLEWSTLSKYTGSDRYRGLAEGSVRRVASQTWGGGSDSYFEYLIKYARLNNTADNFFADHWKLAVDSSIKNLTGIGPEAFAYVPKNSAGAAPADQTLFNAQHGFYITSPYYILRPEVLESNFYAWRVTGNIKYFERAVSAVESFNKYLSANGAFAGLYDVNNIMSRKVDDMESFWFAEVLKYLYLTFDDPGHISLDQYVFNTEAHPFKIPPPKDTYGSGGLPTPTSNAPAFHMVDGSMPQVSQSRGLLSFLGGR